MWNTLTWRGLWSKEAAEELATFRKDALQFLLWIAAAGYLAWHILVTLSPSRPALGDDAIRHWSLVPIVLAGLLVTFLLLRHFPHAAVAWFLVWAVAAATTASWLLHSSAALALYPIISLTALVLLHPLAGVFTSTAAAALLLGLWQLGPLSFLSADRLIEVTVMSLLAVIVPWSLWRNMVTAIYWSLDSYTRAQQNLAEARTHRGNLVQALRQLDSAYYRLERANAALEIAWKSAEAAERSKSEFVTSISHELRTPLNLIVGFSDMIVTSPASYGAPLPAAYRSDVFVIYRNAQHLLTLTEDVIDLARVGAGRLALTRETTDLGSVIGEACDTVREYITAKGLELGIDIQTNIPPLSIDRARIRQVLLNLLMNAARFTVQGTISVAATASESWVAVTVRDTGCGISPDNVPKVFEEFYHQEREPSRQQTVFGGTGLGLPISRKLVALHGGQMTVESTVGVGTAFTFTLPVSEVDGVSVDGVAAASLGRRPPGVGERTLVLVTNDRRLATFLQRHLRGCRVLAVPDLDEAARLAVELHAEAILADLDARDPSRSQLAQHAQYAPVPIIWLPLPHQERVASALGAVAFLPKPLSRAELQATIEGMDRPVRTILVTDDDDDFLRMISRMLQDDTDGAGYRVRTARNGREALASIETEKPDVLLLDLAMPDMSGREVIAALAQDPMLADIPIVVVSAEDQGDWRAQLQGTVTIEKPNGMRLEELLSLVDSALGALDPPYSLLTERTARPDGLGKRG